MNKTIGILAHVDAGKTTFSEQVLYHTKSIKSIGRVDHKNSFLDSHNIEKERGITVFSDQAIFKYKNSTYYLVDTPGHADFSPEMERTISIMDYAIVIISAVEGIEAQTEVIWQLLRKYKVPTFFFINKIDRVNANLLATIEDIRKNLTEEVFLLEDKISEEQIEFIAEREDRLLKKYLEGEYEEKLWIHYMRKMIKENKIFPCLGGSALQDIGIDNFLERLEQLTFTEYDEKAKFSGQVYKIKYDEKGAKWTYIKALSGGLKVRDNILLKGENEKVSSIRLYNGSRFETVNIVEAGQLFAVTGLNNTYIGQYLGEAHNEIKYEMLSTLKSKVIFDDKLNEKDVLSYFKILEIEDPSLNILWNEALREIEVHIMGVFQLEILKELLLERFKLSVDFGPCEILYKETISSQSIGYGHFEPLGHYAEVHLKLEPGNRNSGITFESKCHSDNLTIGNQNLARSHVFEKEHHGILTGAPITDIKITLLTGKAHNKHTSGGDFREATFRALRQGLESTDNIMLEPYYSFKIEIHVEYLGRVLSDLQRLRGTFEMPEAIEGKAVINGRGPVETFMSYALEFASITKGSGKISFKFDGYDLCHGNEAEIIKKAGYDKNADIEYTSASIFCSKGQAYLVKAEEAKAYMHCL